MVVAGGQDGTLAVWDVKSGGSVFSIKAHLDAIHDVAVTSDGAKLVTVGSDRTSKVWSTKEKSLLRVLKGHNAPVFACAVNPDSSLAATASYDGTTKVWDIDSDLDGVRIQSADYSPAKNLLVGSRGNRVCLWDAPSEHLIRTFEATNFPIRFVALSPKAVRLAAVAHETIEAREVDVMRLYDLESGAELRSIEVGESGVSSIAWSPDGVRVAVVTGSALTLWNSEDGQKVVRFEQVVGYAFSPDGSLLAYGLETGNVKVHDIAAAAEKFSMEAPVKLGITLAFTPDGKQLAAGCDAVSDAGYTGLIKVWSMADGAQAAVVENAHKGHINSIIFSPDGTCMATGGKDKVAKVWTLPDLKEKVAFKGHAGDIVSLTFTPDAQRLATASTDGTFKFWDCVGGRELITLHDAALAAKGESCAPSRIIFSEDMRLMVTLTEPEALAPLVLHAFPWDLKDYPGEVNAELRDRVELFKRQYWNGK